MASDASNSNYISRKVVEHGDQNLDEVETSIDGKNFTLKEKFSFSRSPNLEDIRALQAEFIHERNWEKYHQPRNILLALVGEVGEVAELFQWRGEVEEGLPDWTKEDKDHLAQELSDVMIYLIRLAEKCHVDLPKAVIEKMALNRKKYPVEKIEGRVRIVAN